MVVTVSPLNAYLNDTVQDIYPTFGCKAGIPTGRPVHGNSGYTIFMASVQNFQNPELSKFIVPKILKT